MVIRALREKMQGCSSFSLVIDDILDLSSNFSEIVWSFVKRSGNKVAHALAHFQPREFGTRVWDDELPDNVLVLVAADLIL